VLGGLPAREGLAVHRNTPPTGATRCGWSTTVSAEWAAQSAAKIHASLGWTAKEHAVTVEQPREAQDQAQDQLSLRDQDGER
jgi:hypothetical protein